jgi:hypothetical protein
MNATQVSAGCITVAHGMVDGVCGSKPAILVGCVDNVAAKEKKSSMK